MTLKKKKKIILAGAPTSRLPEVFDAELGAVEFVDAGAAADVEYEVEEIQEADLTTDQVDALKRTAETI